MNNRWLEGMEWFAVQVWTGREHSTVSHLRLRGHDPFLPSYWEHHQWSDRVKKIGRALFPGYVFCRLDASAAAGIMTSPGVIRIVGDGRGPVPVPVHEVETIRKIVEAGLEAKPCEFLQVGQRVRVEAGPLRGAEGLIVAAKNHHRLIVSISLLKRAVAVSIPMECLSVPVTGSFDQIRSRQTG